jgi:hypothetical protein
MKQPRIGDMVHFVNGASLVHLPAVVAKVWSVPETVNLFVFPNGSEVMGQGYTATSIIFSEEPKQYTWHYPE